jgi:hypothetical protein
MINILLLVIFLLLVNNPLPFEALLILLLFLNILIPTDRVFGFLLDPLNLMNDPGLAFDFGHIAQNAS